MSDSTATDAADYNLTLDDLIETVRKFRLAAGKSEVWLHSAVPDSGDDGQPLVLIMDLERLNQDSPLNEPFQPFRLPPAFKIFKGYEPDTTHVILMSEKTFTIDPVGFFDRDIPVYRPGGVRVTREDWETAEDVE